MCADHVLRSAHRLNPDPRRVIAKLFVPGEETQAGRSRARDVIARVLALDEAAVIALADAVIAGYGDRHRHLNQAFDQHFALMAYEIPAAHRLSAERRILIGACFTHEYAPEAAALFNPSLAPHPDQTELAAGQLRFVMTVRCVGEGHVSSIGFRTGILGPGDALVLDEPEPSLTCGSTHRGTYQLRAFQAALADVDDHREIAHLLLAGLPETFTVDQLDAALSGVHEHSLDRDRVQRTIEHVQQLAAATYDVEFPEDSRLTERLLWPTAPAELHGMEDARIVRFTAADDTPTYYATYTAYNGTAVAPFLLATKDFRRFHITPMSGRAAQNKGLALFPRLIDGEYVALSRWDRESLSIVRSNDCRIWNDPQILYPPRYGWELIQVGNCGSPIETPAGWLVLTHGVGPMRSYGLGMLLLDLVDPSTVLATLPEPLLTPNAEERDGYVPNVVYSCGPLLHDGVLTIPYGISDGAIGFAQVGLTDVLSRMVPEPTGLPR